MKKMLSLIVVGMFGVLWNFGCAGDPECQVKDLNSNCCIAPTECREDTGVTENTTEELVKKCQEAFPSSRPLLCDVDFDLKVVVKGFDCKPLDIKKTCRGGDDLINGREAVFYTVQCCE